MEASHDSASGNEPSGSEPSASGSASGSEPSSEQVSNCAFNEWMRCRGCLMNLCKEIFKVC